jgi:hypothetical protein
MSKQPRTGLGRTFAALALLLALAAASFGHVAVASAQDATPAPVECESPGLPPGTPTPMDDMEGMDMGTPPAAVGTPEAMEGMGTPIAEEAPMTMPEPTPLPEGEPADDETAAAITAAIQNYVACYNEGQATGDPSLYVALESESFLMEMGYDNVYDRVADEFGSPFASISLWSVDNPMTYDDGRVSGDASALIGDHWYQDLRVFLTEEDGTWLRDAEAYLRPNPDVEQVSVKGIALSEEVDEATGERSYSFDFLGSPEIPAAEAIIFNVTNNGEELHEAFVIQLPEGADPLGLLDGSVGFEEITFYGGVFGIPPGQTQDLALLNLPEGNYTMVCFFPSPEGIPHAALGMIAEFTVTEPIEFE